MDWLNYHHLLYFWTVAREGGISRAAARLRLAQPTISAQIRLLEAALGERLFQRQGRTLVMTDVGRVVYRYADEIFGIGREMLETLRGRPAGRPLQLAIGVANAVPKLIAYRLLRPAVAGAEPVHVVCREDNAEQLTTQLATHALDVVIADTPAPAHVRVRVFNHLLGESDIAFFAPAPLAARLRRRFPRSIHEAPMLVPTANAALRRALDEWFEREGLRPRVTGEFEDSALMKVFGQATGAAFPAPAVIAADVCRLYAVREIGRTSAIRERYYAISAERRLKHPGVLAITSAARDDVFVTPDDGPVARRRPGRKSRG
jgi:LysR family transcriptional activator of nhaA